MGIQNRHARMPLTLPNVPKHDIPLWDTRASMLAHEARVTREMLSQLSGVQLTEYLDHMRINYPHHTEDIARYRIARLYRAGVHEAVVSRHWTVEWSDLTNSHKIF